MVAVLNEFIALLVGGVSSMATGIAGGIAGMASALFLDTSGASPVLSTFGGILGIFAGTSLAIGLTTRVFIWISNLGKD